MREPNPALTNTVLAGKASKWKSVKGLSQIERTITGKNQKKILIDTPQIKRKTIGNNYPKDVRDLVKVKRKTKKKWISTRKEWKSRKLK